MNYGVWFMAHDAGRMLSDRAAAEHVEGAGCRFHDSWFRISGAGIRVQVFGHRVEG